MLQTRLLNFKVRRVHKTVVDLYTCILCIVYSTNPANIS